MQSENQPVFESTAPKPRFTNCEPNALYNPPLPPDKSFVVVSPELLGLKATDGLANPLNVTAVDNREKPVKSVELGVGKHIVHFHAYDEFGQRAVCVVSLKVVGKLMFIVF